jgi:hypothetical protein
MGHGFTCSSSDTCPTTPPLTNFPAGTGTSFTQAELDNLDWTPVAQFSKVGATAVSTPIPAVIVGYATNPSNTAITPPPVVVAPPPVTVPPPVVTPPPVAPPIAIVPVVQMANAVKICDEGCTIVSMPLGTIYQFGTGTGINWLPPATSTLSNPVLPLLVYYTSFPVGAPGPIDPDSGVLKEFDVQQTSALQTIVFTAAGSTVSVTKIVPALVPPCARPITLQLKGVAVYSGCAD